MFPHVSVNRCLRGTHGWLKAFAQHSTAEFQVNSVFFRLFSLSPFLILSSLTLCQIKLIIQRPTCCRKKSTQLDTYLMLHYFCYTLAYLFLIESGDERNKADIPPTFLGAWLQTAETVENSSGRVRAVLSPSTIRGPDNQRFISQTSRQLIKKLG